jgi:hypothetical protein
MKTGKLTNIEKFAIQYMLNNDSALDDICRELDRSKTAINKYIENELQNITKTIDKIAKSGAVKIKKEEKPNISHMMTSPNSKTKNTRPVIMTEAASARTDESAKRYKRKVSRSARGNLFTTKTCEPIGDEE